MINISKQLYLWQDPQVLLIAGVGATYFRE